MKEHHEFTRREQFELVQLLYEVSELYEDDLEQVARAIIEAGKVPYKHLVVGHLESLVIYYYKQNLITILQNEAIKPRLF